MSSVSMLVKCMRFLGGSMAASQGVCAVALAVDLAYLMQPHM